MKLALIALLLPSALAAVKKTAANAKETAFLEEYVAGEGTQVTDSGLMYRVLKDGSGGSPELATPCSCHYEGRLIDGTKFDSSYDRGTPTSFAPNQARARFVFEKSARAFFPRRARSSGRVGGGM